MPWAVAAAAVGAGASIYGANKASSDAKKAQQQANAGTPSWQLAKPDLQNVLSGAQNLYNQGADYYDFNTVQPMSDQTLAALKGTEQLATGNNGIYDQSRQALGNMLGGTGSLQNLTDTAGGKYLNNNPYLSSMFSSLSGDVQDAVNSQFSASGRTGSPAHAGVMTQQLGNLGAQIYGADYARERQNQLQAADKLAGFGAQGIGLSRGVDDFGYSNLARLGQVGQAYEQQGQRTLADQMARWDFNQNRPWEDLSKYANIASAISGQGQTGQVTHQPSNALGNALGLGASMVPMFSKLGNSDPYAPPPASSVATLPNYAAGQTVAPPQPGWFERNFGGWF
jgi:hypothetical protein